MKYKRLSECAVYSSLRTTNIIEATYVSTENMVPNKGGCEICETIPDAKSASKYEVDDILLSNIRPYFRKIWQASYEGSCSNDVLVVKAINGYVPKFLYYVLSDNNFFNYATITAKGTKMPRGSKDAIMKYLVPDVDVEVQQHIASILSAYDDLIENNNKRIKILEKMAENLYKEWFVRFRFPGHEQTEFENGLPKGWSIACLSEFGISLDSGSRPKGGIDSTLKDGIPSLGAESIQNIGKFDYSSVKYIPYDYYEKMKRGKFDGNAIFLYKDGAYIGKTTIFKNKFPFEQFSVNEHVFILKATNSDYQNYLYLTLHQKEYFNLMQNLNRNAAQPGLSQPDIVRIKIDVPSEAVVRRFNKIVEPIYNEIFELAKKNRNLTKQRDLLLPRLMSGKLKV